MQRYNFNTFNSIEIWIYSFYYTDSSVLCTFEIYSNEMIENNHDGVAVLAMQDGISVLSDFLFHRNILLCFNRRL